MIKFSQCGHLRASDTYDSNHIRAIMFPPLFVHNNKYFSLQPWKMINNMKTDVKRLFFFLENIIEKKLISVLVTLYM